jgi:hypothetical protein
VQAANAAPSRLHSNVLPGSLDVNVKLALVSVVAAAGAELMVVAGGVPSTTTVGWKPLRRNSVVASMKSWVVHVYVFSVLADVAVNDTVSFAPGHKLVSPPPGRFRLIFEFAIRVPSCSHVDPMQPPTAWEIAPTVAGSTTKPVGMAIFVFCALLGDRASFVRVIVYDAEIAGFTCDGVDVAVNASPSAAAAPEARSRQAAATSNSRRWFGTGDPFP